jgi:hypothetical protein
MNARSVKIIIIFIVAFVLLGLVSYETKAQTQDSSSAAALNLAMPPTITPSGFLVEHPYADFTALPGVAYIVMEPNLTCTLSSAVGATGREILIIPSYRPPLAAFVKFTAVKTTGDEGIFCIQSGRNYIKKWSNIKTSSPLRFISDGKNWYYTQ